MSLRRCLLALFMLGSFGCASRVVVTDAVAPKRALEASRAGMQITAVVTPTGRMPVAKGTIVASDGLWAWSKPTIGVRPKAKRFYVFKPADKIEVTGTYGVDDIVPIGGRIASGKSTGLIVTGSIIFGLAYGAAGVAAVASPFESEKKLWVPLFGPWLNLASRPDCVTPEELKNNPSVSDLDPCKLEYAAKVGLSMDGILQGAGVLLLAIGLSGGTSWVPGKSHIAVLPDRHGLQVVGSW